MNYINFKAKAIQVQVDGVRSPSDMPMLTVARVGARSAKQFKVWQFIRQDEQLYYFKTDFSTMRSGRYVFRLSFNGQCCMRFEMEVGGNGCRLLKTTPITKSTCGC